MSGTLLKHHPDWNRINTVLLDMDGTLLDKHFDDYFWQEFLPEQYAVKHDLPPDVAKKKLHNCYRLEEGELNWTDLDFWSKELQLDVPALKEQVDHLIQVHPYVVSFLSFLKEKEKNVYLVTNAHSKTLNLKMNKTKIGNYFNKVISAFDIGLAKEKLDFWRELRETLHFDPATTLLAEDSEDNLRAARSYGITYLYYVAKPSTVGPVIHSKEFPSITYFNELYAANSEE
jgi:HAD superfamily hydrolase (TIGR01509 family)